MQDRLRLIVAMAGFVRGCERIVRVHNHLLQNYRKSKSIDPIFCRRSSHALYRKAVLRASGQDCQDNSDDSNLDEAASWPDAAMAYIVSQACESRVLRRGVEHAFQRCDGGRTLVYGLRCGARYRRGVHGELRVDPD